MQHGRFRKEISLEGWLLGRLEIWTAFQTVLGGEEQLRELINRYGESGERITGPQVEGHPIRQVEAVTVILIQ